MFIYENTTDQVEFKKERGIRKMWEKMINASRDEPGKFVTSLTGRAPGMSPVGSSDFWLGSHQG